jgi:hypothetical protein
MQGLEEAHCGSFNTCVINTDSKCPDISSLYNDCTTGELKHRDGALRRKLLLPSVNGNYQSRTRRLTNLINSNRKCSELIGGASRDRTDDPLLAKQVLSQLSYGPLLKGGGPRRTRTSDLTIISRAL